MIFSPAYPRHIVLGPYDESMKKSVLYIILATFFLTGCSTASLEPQASFDSATSLSSSSSDPNPNPNPHPVSLPALMQKDIHGSDLTLGNVLDNNSAYTRYAITYKSGDLTISGIVNIPKGDGPFPVIITNHGYIDPAVYTIGRGLKREQDYLARRGFAVLHPDYRNHAGSDNDPSSDMNLRIGYTEDIIAAVKAIQASGIPQLDGDRIGMLGHSLGGGMTLNTLVVQPSLVDAAVLFAPVSSNAWENADRWIMRDASRSELAQGLTLLYGNPETQPEFWKNISASNFFDRIETPIQIHHGTADSDVPLAWSEATYTALQGLNKESELHVYQGQPHEFTSDWGLVMERTVTFYKTHL
jgi:dipeptidyl aminopeptidase/acylaminoacyl peptidase